MIRKRTDHLKGVKIGIMGCIVNGPGEMADADYGYVGSGKGKITLYKGKEHEVPLIRIGFPIFDRHHMHRQTTLGYEGAMQILTTLVNSVLERLDDETRGMQTTDYNYDLVR